MAVPAGHSPLELVPYGRLVPLEHAQIFLQRAGRHAGGIGDRFDALTLQVAQLPGDVSVDVPPVGLAAHAPVEDAKIRGQSRFDAQNRFGIHAYDLRNVGLAHICHRLAA
jgi:hypothetical protein